MPRVHVASHRSGWDGPYRVPMIAAIPPTVGLLTFGIPGLLIMIIPMLAGIAVVAWRLR